MDNERAIDTFVILEERLNKVLDGYTKLKEERGEIIAQVRGKEEEVERLKGEISSLNNERLQIRTRIERLIEKLEGIPLDDY